MSATSTTGFYHTQLTIIQKNESLSTKRGSTNLIWEKSEHGVCYETKKGRENGIHSAASDDDSR
jgi:hypothetical protein